VRHFDFSVSFVFFTLWPSSQKSAQHKGRKGEDTKLTKDSDKLLS
jgi:hypothetical protein